MLGHANILFTYVNFKLIFQQPLKNIFSRYSSGVTSGYSIFLIRDPARGTRRFNLRVAWTSAFKQFFHTFSSFPGPLNQNRFDCQVPRPLVVSVIFPHLC